MDSQRIKIVIAAFLPAELEVIYLTTGQALAHDPALGLADAFGTSIGSTGIRREAAKLLVSSAGVRNLKTRLARMCVEDSIALAELVRMAYLVSLTPLSSLQAPGALETFLHDFAGTGAHESRRAG